VSAQLYALVGVVVGALLAGGSSLLLAWRDETIQGRAGVHLIRQILVEAHCEVRRLIDEGESATWNADRLPDSQLWAQYRHAVSARVDLAKLKTIDRAMRRLDWLNSGAARAWKLNGELEQQVWEAAQRDDKKAVEKLGRFRPQRLNPATRERLPTVATELEAALTAVEKAAPTGFNWKSVLPWANWHRRSLIAGIAVAVALAVVFAGLLPLSGSSESVKLQDALAAHLGGRAVTSCEPIHDTEDSFSCIAVETATGSACPVKTTAIQGVRFRLVSELSRPAKEEGGCDTDAIDLALRFFGERSEEADCTTFFQTEKSEAVSAKEMRQPGFLAKLKLRLRQDEGSAEVPPVLLPGTAFTTGC
jgi:hypothetical protein